jgi:hypothetical protein
MTTTGVGNSAFGSSALANATSGGNNIGIGNQAGINVSTGGNNIEIGNGGTSSDTLELPPWMFNLIVSITSCSGTLTPRSPATDQGGRARVKRS